MIEVVINNNLQTVLRIWDCFFCDGPKILLKVAVTLVLTNKDRLVSCRSFVDLVETFGLITKEAEVLDCHKFMEVSRGDHSVDLSFIFRFLGSV